MTTSKEIKNQIEKSAKECDMSVIDFISKMQAELVSIGDEKGIMQLHTLKMEYAKKLKLI